jgi:phosphate-selective porin OprO and OprP
MKGFLRIAFCLLFVCLSSIAFASGRTLVINDNGLVFHPQGSQPFPNFNLWGYVQGEAVKFSRNTFGLKNQVFLHAYYLELTADFNKDVTFNISADFNQQPMVQTAYFQYSGWAHTIVQFGQIFPNFGLNNTDSTGQINFIEFALPSFGLATAYYAGGDVMFYNKQFSSFIAAFGPRIGVRYKQPYPFGIDTRNIWSPVHNKKQVFETGFSIWYQHPDGRNIATLGSVPELDTREMTELVNTGPIPNVRSSMFYDAEIAYQWHSFDTTAEYLIDRASRMNGSPNLDFSGYYVTLSYFLTGEHHPYSFPGADFTDVSKIQHRFGALELTTRLSNLHLNSKDISGGTETNATLGFNWYFSSHLKLMINYIRIFYRNGPTHKNHAYNAMGAQLQATI